MWAAYLDESESMRPAPAYVLAAALIDQEHHNELRARMCALPRKGQKKLHWHEESEKVRTCLTETVATLPVLHVVVVRVSHDGEPSSRRRRKCLAQMVYELTQRGVDHIVAEARGPDEDDRRHLNYLRKSQTAPRGLRIDHLPGRTEPLLWLADIVAGATTAARRGNTEYVDKLANVIEKVTIGG